jgi:hypothetical protein
MSPVGRCPPEVTAQIVAKTDGVPLFVEELTKAVLESGLLVAGRQGWHLDRPLPPFAIPATLQDSLAARLDRLAPVKEIAQIGAAIGREFSYPLLRAVAGRDEPALRMALVQLEDAELLFRSGAPPDARYTFKHALVQDTAYETLLRSRRQILHRQIADVLRGEFAAGATAEPELVAHHLTQAGLDEQAIEWWGKAGDQALRRSAFKEAAAHLGKAIELADQLAAMAPGAAPASNRLRLQTSLGNALIWAKRHHAADTTAAFARARELVSREEDASERFSAYYGLFVGHLNRGEPAPMREMAELFLREATALPDCPEAVIAHRISGTTRWYLGDFAGAHQHFQKTIELYDPAGHDVRQPVRPGSARRSGDLRRPHIVGARSNRRGLADCRPRPRRRRVGSASSDDGCCAGNCGATGTCSLQPGSSRDLRPGVGRHRVSIRSPSLLGRLGGFFSGLGKMVRRCRRVEAR